MSGTNKTEIYNIAFSALLLVRRIANADTDTTNETKVLNTFWNIALESTLQDLDLDKLSQPITLELLANLTTGPWLYVYKYPTNCAFLRRLESGQITDIRSTHIPKRTALYNGQGAIFTNEVEAIAECIPLSVPLTAFNSMATLAVAYRLASLSAPLIVGKGAKKLRETIEAYYIFAKTEAQETDKRENFNFQPDHVTSEWVYARLS